MAQVVDAHGELPAVLRAPRLLLSDKLRARIEAEHVYGPAPATREAPDRRAAAKLTLVRRCRAAHRRPRLLHASNVLRCKPANHRMHQRPVA